MVFEKMSAIAFFYAFQIFTNNFNNPLYTHLTKTKNITNPPTQVLPHPFFKRVQGSGRNTLIYFRLVKRWPIKKSAPAAQQQRVGNLGHATALMFSKEAVKRCPLTSHSALLH